MMVLIDVGNTRIKLGWWDAQRGREPDVQAFALSDPASALTERLGQWLTQHASAWKAAIGVNVAGQDVAAQIEQALAAQSCSVRWMRPTASMLGMTNRYEQPEQLGADRWAALLGVSGRYPANDTPIILATFGTATTIDTLAPGAVFEGGMILPGPALMRSSLARGTANLPHVLGEGHDFPRNTAQAISTGVLSAQSGALWRQCRVVKETYGVWPRVCVSGGAWPEVQAEVMAGMASLQVDVEHLPHPSLDGLARLAQANTNPESFTQSQAHTRSGA